MADNFGVPIAVCVASASQHEVTIVEETVTQCFVSDEYPARLIGDIEVFVRWVLVKLVK
ncbi:MAG: hypothetical protein ABI361_11890 [Nitrososphaera sp.]